MAVTETFPFARPQDHYWTDIDNNFWSAFGPPNRIIKAAELAMMVGDGADAHLFKQPRRCIYHHYDGTNYTEYDVELTLYIMTAATLTINSGTDTACRGLFLGEDGAVGAASDFQYTIAGLMFPYYYKQPKAEQQYVETTLAVGDAIWVIRNGLCDVKNVSGSTDEDKLVPANSGVAATAAALVAPGPQTDAIILAHSWLDRCLGRWKATVTTGNFGLARLCMPPRHVDP